MTTKNRYPKPSWSAAWLILTTPTPVSHSSTAVVPIVSTHYASIYTSQHSSAVLSLPTAQLIHACLAFHPIPLRHYFYGNVTLCLQQLGYATNQPSLKLDSTHQGLPVVSSLLQHIYNACKTMAVITVMRSPFQQSC